MNHEKYDLAVIGAGPAGCMAAIKAGKLGKRVVLFERNDRIGKKLMLTGGGKCNFTNAASMDKFLKNIHPTSEFFRTVLFDFSSQDLIDFFQAKGLGSIQEPNGRILPATNQARSVIEVLDKYLDESKVKIYFNTQIISLKKHDQDFVLFGQGDQQFFAKNVVIACGGVSYPITGSTGDGFDFAQSLGHKITDLNPGLVPLVLKESYVKEFQGLAFDWVSLKVNYDKKKSIYGQGELLFTHFGVSGPVALDLSNQIVPLLKTHEELVLSIDFKPQISVSQLEEKIKAIIVTAGKKQTDSLLESFLPKRMVEISLPRVGLDPKKIINQLTKDQRSKLIKLIKDFRLTIVDHLDNNIAMVTIGGVNAKEINPRTMESKKVCGLYFAGEVIEGAGISGGYNLQIAFSTGSCAGQNAGKQIR